MKEDRRTSFRREIPLWLCVFHSKGINQIKKRQLKINEIFLTWLVIYSYVRFWYLFLFSFIKTMLMSKCLFIIWFRCIVVVTHWSISYYCMPVDRHTCPKYVVNEKNVFLVNNFELQNVFISNGNVTNDVKCTYTRY